MSRGFHRPTLSKRLTEVLSARGYTRTEVEEARATRSLIEACIGVKARPPSMMTDGARHVLEGLCDRAGIDLSGDHSYLMPNVARRSAEEVLVRTSGYAAARALDNSEEIVCEHYSHIEGGELADQMAEAFEEADQNG